MQPCIMWRCKTCCSLQPIVSSRLSLDVCSSLLPSSMEDWTGPYSAQASFSRLHSAYASLMVCWSTNCLLTLGIAAVAFQLQNVVEDKQNMEEQYRQASADVEHLKQDNASLRQQLAEAHKLLKAAGISVGVTSALPTWG